LELDGIHSDYSSLLKQVANNKSTMNSTTSVQDYPVVAILNLGTNSLANCRMYSMQFPMNMLVSTVLTVS